MRQAKARSHLSFHSSLSTTPCLLTTPFVPLHSSLSSQQLTPSRPGTLAPCAGRAPYCVLWRLSSGAWREAGGGRRQRRQGVAAPPALHSVRSVWGHGCCAGAPSAPLHLPAHLSLALPAFPCLPWVLIFLPISASLFLFFTLPSFVSLCPYLLSHLTYLSMPRYLFIFVPLSIPVGVISLHLVPSLPYFPL